MKKRKPSHIRDLMDPSYHPQRKNHPLSHKLREKNREESRATDAALGALVRVKVAEYRIGRTPTLDADGFEMRTTLGDGLRRDAMRSILREAYEAGLL